MKHRLEGSMFYLAGPMDDVPDRGAGWRDDISEFLWRLNIGVLSPFKKAIFGALSEDDTYFQEVNALKEAGLFDEAHEKMKPCAADDYRMVDKADAVILDVNTNVHMCGSYHENQIAVLQRKPIIVHCPTGKASVPNWLHSVAKHEMFFETWDQVRSYINHICFAEEVDDLNRWRFFDYDMIFGKRNEDYSSINF